MNKKTLILAVLTLLVSCSTDNNYSPENIKDVDTELTLFGKGISLPVGNTDRIYVKDFTDDLNIEMLKTDDNGGFYLSMDGELNLDDSFSSLDFSGLNSFEGIRASADLSFNVQGAPEAMTANGHIGNEIQLPEEISVPFSTSFKQTFLEADHFPTAIKRINNLYFSNLKLYLEFSVDNVPADCPDIQITATMALPEYFEPSVIYIDDAVSGSSPVKISCDIIRLKDIDMASGNDIEGEITFEGNLHSNLIENLETLAKGFEGKILIALGDGADSDNIGNISVREFEANVEFDTEHSSFINLGDLSSFMDENNSISVNPEINLTAATNLGMPVMGTISLIPYKNGNPVENSKVVIENLELPCSDNPENVARKDYHFGKEYGFSKLLKTVPDSICTALSAKISPDKPCVFHSDATYSLSAQYGITVPVSFGEGTRLSVTKEFEVGDFMSDIPSLGSVRLDASIASTLPVGAQLRLSFLDSGHNPISCAEEINMTLNASDGVSESISSLSASIALSEALKNAGPCFISMSAAISATADVQLNRNQYIQVKNLSLSAPEGITINPEDLQ